MYVNQPWTIRQYADSPPPPNQRLLPRNLAAPEGSVGGVRPGHHRGYDSDLAGRRRCRNGGVAIDSILDMRQLFDGIDLSTVSV